ncbi:hypothetical protein MRX96_057917 [Rhipicephalus microplus]
MPETSVAFVDAAALVGPSRLAAVFEPHARLGARTAPQCRYSPGKFQLCPSRRGMLFALTDSSDGRDDEVTVPGYKLPSWDDLREKLLPEKVSALKIQLSTSLAGAEGEAAAGALVTESDKRRSLYACVLRAGCGED